LAKLLQPEMISESNIGEQSRVGVAPTRLSEIQRRPWPTRWRRPLAGNQRAGKPLTSWRNCRHRTAVWAHGGRLLRLPAVLPAQSRRSFGLYATLEGAAWRSRTSLSFSPLRPCAPERTERSAPQDPFESCASSSPRTGRRLVRRHGHIAPARRATSPQGGAACPAIRNAKAKVTRGAVEESPSSSPFASKILAPSGMSAAGVPASRGTCARFRTRHNRRVVTCSSSAWTSREERPASGFRGRRRIQNVVHSVVEKPSTPPGVWLVAECPGVVATQAGGACR